MRIKTTDLLLIHLSCLSNSPCPRRNWFRLQHHPALSGRSSPPCTTGCCTHSAGVEIHILLSPSTAFTLFICKRQLKKPTATELFSEPSQFPSKVKQEQLLNAGWIITLLSCRQFSLFFSIIEYCTHNRRKELLCKQFVRKIKCNGSLCGKDLDFPWFGAREHQVLPKHY